MRRKGQIFAPLFAAYAMTIAVIRGAFYFIDKAGLPEPGVIIGGIHLHHYLFGIGVLFLVALASINQRFSKTTLAFFLGISLGMIIDEFQFLLKLAAVSYPTQEFDTINSVALALFLSALAEKVYILRKKPQIKKLAEYPSVSVVIPAYNEENYLTKTLKSLSRQNYPGKLEIIVVDNNSNDRTPQIAKMLGARVIFEARQGVQYARQTGFTAAKGRLIASTDADNILPKNWLTKMVHKMSEDKELVAVGGWFKLETGPILPKIVINFLSNPAIYIYQNLTGKRVLIGQNFLIKKDAFAKTAGFSNLTSMNEDLQLAHRLSKVGKVKLIYADNFKILTSPRRWANSFFRANMPYVVNALSFAFFGKVVFRNFSAVREEKSQFSPARVVAYTFGSLALIIAFLTLPINPAHAKVAPFTYHARNKITTGSKYVRHKIYKGYTNSRKYVSEEYSEEKSLFGH